MRKFIKAMLISVGLFTIATNAYTDKINILSATWRFRVLYSNGVQLYPNVLTSVDKKEVEIQQWWCDTSLKHKTGSYSCKVFPSTLLAWKSSSYEYSFEKIAHRLQSGEMDIRQQDIELIILYQCQHGDEKTWKKHRLRNPLELDVVGDIELKCCKADE